ncbi:MAG: phosphodiester glycosidase family protein [Alphaproteobacteria bacterium]|nr:phosphodiester glycosidase family protein [Alphaproteobacteria bacterium]MCB9796919.1 phosphodiester glycosidase family protein [Alphaproteobacteria bacterium]
MQRPWTTLCAEFAAAHGLDPATLQALTAFSGGAEARLSDFRELDEQTQSVESLSGAVVARLSQEVDPDQARLFARRLRSVHGLLGTLARPEARILRAGLVQRVAEILEAPAPHALRVRAAVDFYYSRAALVHHGGGPPLEEAAARPTWRCVAPGLEHALLDGPSAFGPLHVNLLRLRGGRVEAWRCDPGTGGAPLDAVVAARGADAGISGGFFLYSEPDILPPSQRGDPVGLLVVHGEVLGPPAFRRAAFVEGPEGRRVGPLGPEGMALRWPGGGLTVAACNDPERSPGLFNRAFGLRAPPSPRAAAVVGAEVLTVGAGALTIPLNGFVLTGVPEALRPGTRLRYALPGAPTAAMAGGPMLLQPGGPVRELAAEDFADTAPPITFSRDETYDQNLLPRMAAGLQPDGALVLAAVDGRNFERAPGLTLAGLSTLMATLGCERAMNLDGGSSKRMVVEGRVVDLPSTEVVSGGGGAARVRPVRTGLLLYAGRQT